MSRSTTRIVLAFFLVPAVTAAGLTMLAADPAPDCQRSPCVPGVVEQFYNLQRHGDPLAFWLGQGDDPRTCKHYQGMARGAADDGTPYLFLTRSGNCVWTCLSPCSDDPGELLVVRMGSRDKDGERFRSNLMAPDRKLDDTPPPFLDPLRMDIGVLSIHFDGGTHHGALWPGWSHLGGVQLVGDVLVVPVEQPYPGSHGADGGVILVDVQDPLHPAPLAEITHFDVDHDGQPDPTAPLGQIGVAGVAWDHDLGRYLFALTWGGSELVWYAVSDTDDLRTTANLQPLVLWTENWLGPDKDQWRPWQTMNFVRDVNGELYLLGAEKAAGSTTDDWLGLFRVDADTLNPGEASQAVSFVMEHDLFLDKPDMGSLDAASGAYASPSGQLIVYTAPHDNDAPMGSVEMGEFRSIYVSHTRTCGPQFRDHHLGGPYFLHEGDQQILDGTVRLIEPWAHLFEELSFGRYKQGTALMLDWRDLWPIGPEDHHLDFPEVGGWYNNSWKSGFNDALDSFTFCGPRGSALYLFDDDSWQTTGNEGYVTCYGDGTVMEVPDVRNLPSVCDVDHPCCQPIGDDFHDEATSAAIQWTPPAPTYEWFLQGDGTLTPVDDGSSAIYVAGCGASSGEVGLTVWGEEVRAAIEVEGIPPTIESWTLSALEMDEGTSVSVEGLWTDPCDPLAAVEVSWGDGNTARDSANGGGFGFSHRYGDNGDFDIELCVKDGSGATCEHRTLIVRNVTPTAAIDRTGARILPGGEAFLVSAGVAFPFTARSTDPGSDDLRIAWDWDDGDPSPDLQIDSLVNPPIPDPFPSTSVQPRVVEDLRQHAFTAACLHHPTLTVTDDDGGSAVDEVLVVVTGTAGAPRGAGFWQNQCRAGGPAARNPGPVVCLLETAALMSRVFDDARNASDPAAALDVLRVRQSKGSMTELLDRQLLTTWLNVANGGLGYDAQVDSDGDGLPDTPLSLVLQTAEEARLRANATRSELERHKDILERINEGH